MKVIIRWIHSWAILGLFFSTSQSGLGQTSEGVDAGRGKATGIFKSIEERNFQQASDKIRDYQEKFGQTAVLDYLEFLLLQNESAPGYNLPEACRKIGAALLNEAKIEAKDREFLCKRINFCREEMQRQENSVHERYFEKIRTSEPELTGFISLFPGSQMQRKAKLTRDSLRFAVTEKSGTAEAYQKFIDENPGSRELEEASFRRMVLHWQAAEKSNTPESYSAFLKQEPQAPEYLKAQARLAGRSLPMEPLFRRLNDTLLVYRVMLEAIQRDPSGASGTVKILNKKIEDATIRYKGRLYSPKKSFSQLEEALHTTSHTAIESSAWQETVATLWKLKNEIAFLAIEKSKPDEEHMRAYMETFPSAYQSRIFQTKLNQLKAKAVFEQKEQEKIAAEHARLAEIARKKAEEEAIRQEKINKLEKTLIFKAVNKLPPNYKAELLTLLEDAYNTDPQGKVGEPCGLDYGKCEWCGKSIEYRQTLKSRAADFRLMVQFSGFLDVSLGLSSILMPFASAFSSIFTGETPKPVTTTQDQIIVDLSKEVKLGLDQIRSGDFYYCGTDVHSKYCSNKCEYDHKDSKRR